MLKLSDLAQRPDFKLGPLEISPARRRVIGPAGEAQVEPLIMQMFLLLLDAGGRVVTRDEIFEALWGGVMVGDDSLNRAVRMVRRIIADTAPCLLEIETVPRTGYRIVGEIVGPPVALGDDSAISRRRVLIGAGGVAAAGLGGIALFRSRGRDERHFDALMVKGEEALDYGDHAPQASQYLRRAVALRPDSARALGLLAYSRANDAEYGPSADAPAAVSDAQRAARAALSLDPRTPDAQLAQTLLDHSTLDIAANEDRIRQILATDPGNIRVMEELWSLLQCVGRSHDSLAVIDRAIAAKPLAAADNYPRAQLLWILGRNAEADRVIDRAMQYWPEHRYVRFARFYIFAFTDRPRAALAMLDGKNTAPQGFSPESVALWRVSLAALEQRNPATLAAARTACLAAAQANLRLAPQAILVMSALGDVDTAFQITNQLFAIPGREPIGRAAVTTAANASSTAWRFAPWLFVPAAASLRVDARFNTLCDGIGLTDYWRNRGGQPDAFLFADQKLA